MRLLIHFFIVCIIIILGIVLMNSQVFRVFDTNPNILMVLIMVLIVSRIRFSVLCAVLGLLALFSYLFFPFWGLEYGFIILCGLLIFLIRSRFTGNSMGDIVIFSSIGIIIFSLLNWFFTNSPLFVVPLIYEVVYNGIWAIVLLSAFKGFLKHSPMIRL